jgi:hypothetical protein
MKNIPYNAFVPSLIWSLKALKTSKSFINEFEKISVKSTEGCGTAAFCVCVGSQMERYAIRV